MDKVVLKFLADVLYIKGVVCYEEFEAVMDAKSSFDLDKIVDRILRSDFNIHRRGEGYDKSISL